MHLLALFAVPAATLTFTAASAQEILPRAESVFSVPFSRIGGIRELSDGRLLVTDGLEKALYVLNWDEGNADQLGRNGAGPREYERPRELFSLAGDSTWMFDVGNFRSAILDPSGRIVRTIQVRFGDGSFRVPDGSDHRGNVYFTGRSRTPDTPLLRWHYDADALDTVATLHGDPRIQTRNPGDKRRAFRVVDGWGVSSDGTIAIVRQDVYRVDWHHPDGSITTGAPVDYRPMEITGDERDRLAEYLAAKTATFSVSGTAPGRLSADDFDIPDEYPVFNYRGIFMATDNRLWVRLYQPVNAQTELYHVFSQTSPTPLTVRLPAGRELLGFGESRFFAFFEDADGFQWIERYPMPR